MFLVRVETRVSVEEVGVGEGKILAWSRREDLLEVLLEVRVCVRYDPDPGLLLFKLLPPVPPKDLRKFHTRSLTDYQRHPNPNPFFPSPGSRYPMTRVSGSRSTSPLSFAYP